MNEIWRELLQAWPSVTLAIGLVLTIGATLHILLTKREVASAVGWIGLVWFAPILGAISYLMFGVNRVRRRARRLRPPDTGPASPSAPHPAGVRDNLEALEHGIGRITGRPLLAGTRVQAYQNGDEAYPPMLAAIAAAKASVGLSSYILRDDQWGGRFIDALAEATRRGVSVRVLIDGIGGDWLRSPAYHRLRREGVPAARFMHSLLPWRMPFFNLRSHKKVLLLDGVVSFTGGMNIADENVMATRPQEPVQDLHFRIEGPVVSQLAEAFADDWSFETGEDLAGDLWSPEIAARTGPPARVIDSGPDEDLEKVEFAVLQAVSCARASIEVMTPYFLPDERLVTALALAAMRGVAVDLVVPEQSNHTLVDWATRANIGPLLSGGVRIWRSPPPFHHTKIMVVDGEWCLIGSCNWDIRSFRLNFELCMEIYDRDLATRLRAIMQDARGSELTRAEVDSRSLPVRIRDAAARLMLPYL
ncbi:MAG: cardiolipin synthase [Acetobacteraceae bacterium]|jgi:cardiolipin synthase A/B|nr:cardiolipin synthase [Acetobacteraceae bacterium]